MAYNITYMILSCFCLSAEEMNVPNLYPYWTGFYEIFMPEVRRFGYGFRINWKKEVLIGICITNDGLPIPEPVSEPLQSCEQLKLPFDDEHYEKENND